MCQTRVLVVDDESDIRTILRRLLLREGFCVVEAGDGLEALDAAQHCDVQIIVMDINMPRMTGTEAVRRLRAMPQFSHTPILIITGNFLGASYCCPTPLGNVILLPKPLNLDEVLTAIQDAIHIR
ncbi:MAG TPA: response regulator [Roseiflexaceae bacterium]